MSYSPHQVGIIEKDPALCGAAVGATVEIHNPKCQRTVVSFDAKVVPLK